MFIYLNNLNILVINYKNYTYTFLYLLLLILNNLLKNVFWTTVFVPSKIIRVPLVIIIISGTLEVFGFVLDEIGNGEAHV